MFRAKHLHALHSDISSLNPSCLPNAPSEPSESFQTSTPRVQSSRATADPHAWEELRAQQRAAEGPIRESESSIASKAGTAHQRSREHEASPVGY